ncbi:PLC-like phosphodiesterase [Flammula alnicola]|nr:PLC-like phosphodiesterase [Flammula alnicola]
MMVMEPPRPRRHPDRVLKRAEGLLTSNGQVVVKELAEDPYSQPAPSPTSNNGFGASFKRTIQGLKNRSIAIGRSKSLSRHKTPSTDDDRPTPRRGHSRSLTDLSILPPMPSHVQSAPPSRAKRLSAQPRPPALSIVSEGVSSYHMPAPTAEPEPEPPSPVIGDVKTLRLLQRGTLMTKVSAKKHKVCLFRLDADLGQIVWVSKKHKIIPIENIKEIRSGYDARYNREHLQLAKEYQDRWLTIIYILDGNYKTLHLIAPDKETYQMWDHTLRDLHSMRQELMRGLGRGEMRQALWEKQYWKAADEEPDHKLSFNEIENLCRKLNINSNREDLLRLFKQADAQKRQFLDFDDFRRFVKLLKARPEVDRLYKKLRTANDGIFDFGVFEKFMKEKQKETTCAVMTVDAFMSFLLSPDNSAFTDQHSDVWQDMTRPLSEYFISSSHNTYLVGHQLVGSSTTEGYIRALLHSCRSVELDIYDGDLEPMIFHGKTLTTKVSLREVCQAIMKYGFSTSPYPIIISAEVHCSLPQQDWIAAIMTEEFGESLVRVPPEGLPKIEALPSPEQLKGKILLKVRFYYIDGMMDSIDSDGYFTDMSSSTSDSDMFFEIMRELPDDTTKKKQQTQSDSSMKEQISKAKINIIQRVKNVGGKGSTSKAKEMSPLSMPIIASTSLPASLPSLASPPLSAALKTPGVAARRLSDVDGRPKPKMSLRLLALLVYTVGVKCRGINKKEEYAPEHMFSLSEKMANKMLRFSMWDLIKHTKTHLVRTYPKGMRVSSTNYEPHRFWAAGAQLVALNWQTFDLGYMINHAMFQRNGRSGYVLKPDAIRLAQKELLAKRTFHSLDVKVISAQQLPRPKDAFGHEIGDKVIADPYVEVTTYIPDWPVLPESKKAKDLGKDKDKAEVKPKDIVGNGTPNSPILSPPATAMASTPGRSVTKRTAVVKKNGFNPVWEEELCLPFDCVGDMMDLIFVRFIVRQEVKDTDEPLAVYCASLGSLQQGYRHLPLHDSQLSQYLFSTLFVRINVTPLTPAS